MVSIIIATYQRVHYLKFALKSIFEQTNQDFEVIVIDDGSTDGTEKLVSSFQECRYYYQENMGVSKAKNKGVQLAKGHYISFLDSDDFWHPQKLEKQLLEFNTNKNVDIVFTHGEQFISQELHEEEKKRLYCPPQPMPAPISSSLLCSHETFDRIGEFDEEILVGIDIDWYLRAKSKDLSIKILPDTLLYRRVHLSNSGFTHRDKKQQHISVVKAHLDRIRKNPNVKKVSL
jgi:glycosyltransferase involved in cell wall biosynthesis